MTSDQKALLTDLLPPGLADPDAVYAAFEGWARDQGTPLYPHQEDALISVLAGDNVVLSTPTGSGKSLVATGAHLAALASDRVSFYTAPIKALVSEKFFALCEVFGASEVGMLTGDASVNPDAPIICCTAEILANIALREGADADVGLVIMDEFHFYAEPDRGWAWQVPLLELPQAQFILMSATLGDLTELSEDLTRRNGRATALVTGTERPVPLSFTWALTPLPETIEELLTTHQSPVYVVHFTQAAALEQAQALMSLKGTVKADRAAIAERIGGFRFTAGFGRTLSTLVRSGIGVHHAGMLPRYRRLVEQLAQDGLLKVICGTDTLGVGINVPIRTVLFTGLVKFDGSRQRILKAREFHQIAGRAGRAGFDTSGSVVVQAPEHVIDNARAIAKAGDDPKKLKKVQRRKPADGEVSWTEQTYDKLVAADPEPLVSRMRVDHSMILNVVQRPGDPVRALSHLLRDNHETLRNQARLSRRAITLGKSMLDTGVLQRISPPAPDGRTIEVRGGLQDDFALNQPLAPLALAAFDVLDPESPTHALDVVSVIEAILDDPRQVLMAQQFKAKGEAVAEMKADGVEYDERMALLEEVSWPKPLADLLEATFEIFRQSHPWVSESALSPKSVVRDMYERAMTFTEFVSAYQLARSEGLVLRYLTDAYRTLRQTVPDRPPQRAVRRPLRVARRDRAPDRLLTARRVGGAVRPRRERAARGARGPGRARRHPPEPPDHRQRARLPGDGPQRDVPARGAGCARPVRRPGPARRRERRPPRARPEHPDGPGRVGRGPGRLLRRPRQHRHRLRRPRTAAARGHRRQRTPARRDRAGPRPPPLGGAPDAARPRGRPRLGDRGGGRPRRLRRRR